ncbi:MAG: hypothetical protein JRH10_18315 [Deltaproteobacteria bacterium]|nr:hypothetical protein [Deltaproteobacteria bacterium]MBW2444465.1 hypothetical protein [Deltaproteobacteria bacterium]
MLTRIDRVQLAVPDREAAARGWVSLLGAEHAGDDSIAGLGAKRSRYRLGDGFVELLEPDGAGEVGDAVSVRGAHLFAAGAATPDLAALRAHLHDRGVRPHEEAGQLHLDAEQTGGHGLRIVVSSEEALEPIGAVDGLYEVTNLVQDAKATSTACADLFGLAASAFVPIDSSHFGYDGFLTLFHPDRLHRFEVITPRVPENTMGRFFTRSGECLYMAFAESVELASIEERAAGEKVGFTAVPPAKGAGSDGPDTIFLHPKTLGGMMLGISRRHHAWTWSGSPERARTGR